MTRTVLYEHDEETQDLLIRSFFSAHLGAKVSDHSFGVFGDIYILDQGERVFPRFLAAKCPKIKRFGSHGNARAALETIIHELEKTFRLIDSPWVNQFLDIRIIHGWPFVISKFQHGTLADLIGKPLALSDADRVITLIQIIRALRMAGERGVAAHQDLKPQNIFFRNLHRDFVGAEGSNGIKYQMLVADFGNADVFKEFGRNTGTRPYMAPEQFDNAIIKDAGGVALDIFGLAIIAHELFCDGRHPIGERTEDVWPQRPGVSRKWGEARPWENWSKLKDKDLSLLETRAPKELFPLLSASMSPSPEQRPDAESVETALWKALQAIEAAAEINVRFQVEQLEKMYEGNQWPYFEERLNMLRNFYAER